MKIRTGHYGVIILYTERASNTKIKNQTGLLLSQMIPKEEKNLDFSVECQALNYKSMPVEIILNIRIYMRFLAELEAQNSPVNNFQIVQ